MTKKIYLLKVSGMQYPVGLDEEELKIFLSKTQSEYKPWGVYRLVGDFEINLQLKEIGLPGPPKGN